MTWTVDNRWSPGGSGKEAPAWPDALAAYSARWIDYGDFRPADIVPDRQGFAYDDTLHRNFLIERLENAKGHVLVGEVVGATGECLERDVTYHLLDDGRLQMFVRRAGGYFYVDAWIPR